MNSISAAGEKFEKLYLKDQYSFVPAWYYIPLVSRPFAVSLIRIFMSGHYVQWHLLIRIGLIASGEGVLQRQRMRFRSPVPALFLPLPSLFPSLPPDHLLFSIGPFRSLAPCDHARRATSCVSAVPFQPNGYPTVGRAWCVRLSLSLALSLMAAPRLVPHDLALAEITQQASSTIDVGRPPAQILRTFAGNTD